MFETVLFYAALWTEGNGWPLLAGLGTGMGILALLAVVLLRTSARLPIGQFFAANTPMMILILSGGLCYTIGAVVYGLKKPNPIPGHFGFHEIFHSLTVLAFMSHWTASLLIALSPAAGSLGG